MAALAGFTRQQLVSRLDEQTLDVAHLRTALDVQMNRISHMYIAVGAPSREHRPSPHLLCAQQHCDRGRVHRG